jgi:hypothetical protein
MSILLYYLTVGLIEKSNRACALRLLLNNKSFFFMDGCINITAYNKWRKQYEQTSYCIEFWAHKVVIPTECQLNAYVCDFDYNPYMKI